jgi:hypothetical protein
MRAYTLIPALLFGIGMLATLARTSGMGVPPAAPADTCSPSYLGIYDFPVGDVFQDVESQSYSGGGIVPFADTYRKYKVVSRERLANGYRYGIEGLTHRVTGYLRSTDTARKHTYGQVSETWDFLDSAGQRLDACQDRMVKLPSIAGNGKPCFSRVRIAIGDIRNFPLSSDTTRIKILGTPIGSTSGNALYEDSAGKIPVTSAAAVRYSAVYAAGLGCVRLDAFSFETSVGSQLQGHIRGNDTLGVISPDEDFMPPVSTRMEGLAAKRKSDRIRISRSALVFLVPGGPGFRDLRGESVGKR